MNFNMAVLYIISLVMISVINALPLIGNITETESYAPGTPYFYGGSTTLRDLGVLTMKMMETLSNSDKEETVNLHGLKELISVISEGATLVDNPKDTFSKERLDEISKRLTYLEEENKIMRSKMQSLPDASRRITANKGNESDYGGSMFKGYIGKSVSVAEGTIVKMDQVVINRAGCYNKEYGYYSCPFTGYYLLSVTLQGQSTRMGVTVLVNGSSVMALQSGSCSDNITVRGYSGSSQTVNHCARMLSNSEVVKCEVGQSIHLEATYSGTLVGASNDIPQNYFSIIFYMA